MTDIVKYIRWGILLLLYYSSCMIPRSTNIWIFGSWLGQKFSDNSKYLFLYTRSNHPEIRAIWLTHNGKIVQELSQQGYEVYKAISVKGFLYSLRAGCVIVSSTFDDVNKYVIGRPKKVQLFHGTPLKRIGYDAELTLLSRYKAASKVRKLITRLVNRISPLCRSNLDVLIASSEESKQKHTSAFKVDKNQVYVTGHPRNDALMGAEWLGSGKSDYLDNIANRVAYKYVFTYLPTFRDTRRGNPDLFGRYGFDTNAVQQILERLNAILIMKGHYVDNKLDLPTDGKTLERIYTPSDEELPDIYPLLKETDILITDYSSVYFDYLLLNRPIVFAPFDINEYVEEDRELYYDYNEVTPGPKARDWPEVFSLVEEVIQEDRWERQREAVCSRFNKFRDNKNSERVFKAIQEILA